MGSAPPIAAPRQRGRPAAASRQDVLEAARRKFLACERVDVQEIAGELGLARASEARWFGSRDGLLGEVLAADFLTNFRGARERVRSHGALAVLETFDLIAKLLARSEPLGAFLRKEEGRAVRLLTSCAGPVHPTVVTAAQELIEREARESGYYPPIRPPTLGYALIRLSEAFIYNDAVGSIRGEVDRLVEVQAALLGIAAPKPRRRG